MKTLVLVTGGAGFIGSHTVDHLLDLGYDVRVYDSLVDQVHPLGVPKHLNPNAEFVRGDMRDADRLHEALKGVSVVVNLAAEVGVGQSMYEISRYVDANTSGTGTLLDVLVNRPHRVERMVVASSMSIYGEGAYECVEHGPVYPSLRPGEMLSNRDWEPRCPTCDWPLAPVATTEAKPLRPTSVYAISKMDQELLTLAVAPSLGIRAIALRYFNTYGTRQALSNPYTGVGAIFCSRLLNGNPPLVYEDGLQMRDFIHVSDVARANVLAFESEADGVALNIGTGRPRTVLDVANVLASTMGKEIGPEVLGNFRTGDIRHCFADPTAAIETIGFSATTSFEDGVSSLIEWVQRQSVDDRFENANSELKERGLLT